MNHRIISTILAVSKLASLSVAASLALTSCGKVDEPIIETDDTSMAEETLFANIPNDTDFNGAVVRIYTRGDTNESEFDASETGDIVDDAIYKRNVIIEENLNVDLEYFTNTSVDFWGDRNIYMDTVRASVLANDGSIDIAAGLSNIMPYLAQDGLFYNLLSPDMPYIDFDSPWWPNELTNELAVQDRMYLTSGEVCLGVVKGMMCYYFNKDLIEQYQLENPYELVRDGKWTLDKFDQMAAAAYSDLNGNAAVDDGDQFGFIIANENHALNFLTACGFHYTETGEDGRPRYNLGTEPVISLLDKLNKTLTQNGFGIVLDANKELYSKNFIEGRAMFTTGEFQYAETYRDLDFDYGIIPYPKLDENQENYVSSSRATYSLLGITVTADKEPAAAVLEAIASENYRTVTPTYFEKALKVKYARDDVSSQMFDLIRNNISFDFGIVHGPMMGNISVSLRMNICYLKGNWSSTWAANEASVNQVLSDYLDKLLSLEN